MQFIILLLYVPIVIEEVTVYRNFTYSGFVMVQKRPLRISKKKIKLHTANTANTGDTSPLTPGILLGKSRLILIIILIRGLLGL